MDSTSTHHQSYENQSNQSNNSGLLRFRSAPSSLLADFMNSSGGSGRGGSGMEDKSGSEAAGAAVNYSGLLPPQYPRQSSAAMDNSSFDLLGMNRTSQGEPVTSSGLMRQTSSPPGLFTNLSVQNGYSSMKGLGNYCGELSPSSTRLKNQISFSSRQPSSLSLLSQISEISEESSGANSYDGGAKLGNSFGNEYQCGSWNGSSQFTDSLSSMKRSRDDEHKFFSDNQNGDLGSRVNVLTHHLSLSKTSNEMAAVEKYLHFQDSVPCKIRAKRGCATHPRSIAERVRRTRISERMRKIQELVPNMDKQTNTADMLDLAVEYIKDLQKQFKSLSDKRAKCKCLNAQKAVANQIV